MRDHHGDRLDLIDLLEGRERVVDEGATVQHHQRLGGRRSEPLAAPGRRNDGRRPNPGVHRVAPSFSSAFGRAKIIRPATVCRTLVTTVSRVSPMCRFPPSTTIIVPSSR